MPLEPYQVHAVRHAQHDPIVRDLYPAAAPGREGIAVRLDADPKDRGRRRLDGRRTDKG